MVLPCNSQKLFGLSGLNCYTDAYGVHLASCLSGAILYDHLFWRDTFHIPCVLVLAHICVVCDCFAYTYSSAGHLFRDIGKNPESEISRRRKHCNYPDNKQRATQESCKVTSGASYSPRHNHVMLNEVKHLINTASPAQCQDGWSDGQKAFKEKTLSCNH